MSDSGIKTLLNAEKEALKIVNDARQYRQDKLKQAKKDAAAEIQAYKQKKQEELSQYEAEHSGLNETLEKDAQKQVETELADIKVIAEKKKDDVIKLLIDAVINPTPEIHINA